MNNSLIYTDICHDNIKIEIKKRLEMDVILGIDPKIWTINDALSIIMTPSIKLAVINTINETTVMEMGLLCFMSKPILITAPTIKDYPVLEKKIASYIRCECDLRNENSEFIDWYINQEIQ